jgi:hypothetical protein
VGVVRETAGQRVEALYVGGRVGCQGPVAEAVVVRPAGLAEVHDRWLAGCAEELFGAWLAGAGLDDQLHVADLQERPDELAEDGVGCS